MKKIIVRLVLLLGLALAAGCGLGPDLPCPIPLELNAPGEGRVAFSLQNDSCTTICGLYISPTACDDWGMEWLGDDNVHSGESASVYLPPGRYDAMIEYCTDEAFIIERLRIEEDQTWTLSSEDPADGPPCGTSLAVVNNSPSPICHMWIANQYSERFGNNWLGNEQIASGETRLFVLEPGTYDLKAEACDWTLLRIEVGVPLSGPVTWTVP
ncbi:MAG: hypothetical protein JXB85_16715 [Anaerolineales bacterium]|nr:hypothetical protein [Anaerolineales bacterium]